MCQCKNMANYRKINNEIKNVVDIFTRINDVHKMEMFIDVDWKIEKCLMQKYIYKECWNLQHVKYWD